MIGSSLPLSSSRSSAAASSAVVWNRFAASGSMHRRDQPIDLGRHVGSIDRDGRRRLLHARLQLGDRALRVRRAALPSSMS